MTAQNQEVSLPRGTCEPMEAPLMGEHRIEVIDVRPLEIHGSRYLDLTYALDGDRSGVRHTARIGPEAVQGDLRPGSACQAAFAMRLLIGVRALSDGDAPPDLPRSEAPRP